ncbi:uncharacterized protein LOC135945827 [Cloeon dipterum]|uniref:uncharacterized protein LOC135945827 n=1 Tax=Cloeon dipterum TaxID=197152 RepID=UPI00321FA937
MKTIFLVLALALVAQSKPARNPYDIFNHPFFRVPSFSDEVSSEDSQSESAPDYSEVPAVPSPFHPTAGTYSLNTMLDGIFKRMRDQFDRLPTPNFHSFGFPAVDGPNGPPSKSTSTSTVVGDHVVTVNETEYHNEDGGHKSVFRIKVIDFSPKKDASKKQPVEAESSSVEEIVEVDLPSEKAPENDVTTTESGESLEKEMDNEIPSQSQESLMDTIKRWNEHKQIARSATDEDVELIPGAETPIDLTGDLKVNQILQDQARKGGLFMPDPDAEFIEVDDDGKLVPINLQEI